MRVARRKDTGRAAHRPLEQPGPRRRCVATGARAERGALVRFVRAPDGGVVPDLAARLPGRGVWVAARADAIDRACRRGLIARGLGAGVAAAPDLAATVETLLAQRVQDGIGLARRAGAVGVGLEAVRAMAAAGEIAFVLAAVDGAAGGRAKLAFLAGASPVIALFTAAELGAAVGRDHVVQMAFKAGGPAERLRADLERLAGFRALGDDGRRWRE